MNSPAVKQQEWVKGESNEGLSKEDILRAMIASTGEGPGRFLQQFREQTGMSDMEAASRMNVSLHQLRALELDDFANLPAPIYVRSYLRRFAELFDLPVGDLFAAYERCGETVTPTISRVSQRERIHSPGVPTKWITYGVGVLIVIASLWMAKSVGIDEWIKNIGGSDTEEVSQKLELPGLSVQEVVPEDIPVS
jgi:cytoskeleton protein RodZ